MFDWDKAYLSLKNIGNDTTVETIQKYLTGYKKLDKDSILQRDKFSSEIIEAFFSIKEDNIRDEIVLEMLEYNVRVQEKDAKEFKNKTKHLFYDKDISFFHKLRLLNTIKYTDKELKKYIEELFKSEKTYNRTTLNVTAEDLKIFESKLSFEQVGKLIGYIKDSDARHNSNSDRDLRNQLISSVIQKLPEFNFDNRQNYLTLLRENNLKLETFLSVIVENLDEENSIEQIISFLEQDLDLNNDVEFHKINAQKNLMRLEKIILSKMLIKDKIVNELFQKKYQRKIEHLSPLDDYSPAKDFIKTMEDFGIREVAGKKIYEFKDRDMESYQMKEVYEDAIEQLERRAIVMSNNLNELLDIIESNIFDDKIINFKKFADLSRSLTYDEIRSFKFVVDKIYDEINGGYRLNINQDEAFEKLQEIVDSFEEFIISKNDFNSDRVENTNPLVNSFISFVQNMKNKMNEKKVLIILRQEYNEIKRKETFNILENNEFKHSILTIALEGLDSKFSLNITDELREYIYTKKSSESSLYKFLYLQGDIYKSFPKEENIYSKVAILTTELVERVKSSDVEIKFSDTDFNSLAFDSIANSSELLSLQVIYSKLKFGGFNNVIEELNNNTDYEIFKKFLNILSKKFIFKLSNDDLDYVNKYIIENVNSDNIEDVSKLLILDNKEVNQKILLENKKHNKVDLISYMIATSISILKGYDGSDGKRFNGLTSLSEVTLDLTSEEKWNVFSYLLNENLLSDKNLLEIKPLLSRDFIWNDYNSIIKLVKGMSIFSHTKESLISAMPSKVVPVFNELIKNDVENWEPYMREALMSQMMEKNKPEASEKKARKKI